SKLKIINRANIKISESRINNSTFNKTSISDSSFFVTENISFSKMKKAEYQNSFVIKYDNLKRTAFNLELNSRITRQISNLTDYQSGNFTDTLFANSKIPFYNFIFFASGATRISSNKAVGFGINASSKRDKGFTDFSTERFAQYYGLPDNFN